MAQELIIIDPGHGGSDPGAVGHGLRESDIVLAVSTMVASAIRSRGVNVSMTRTRDVDLPQTHRIAAIRRPSTAVVSIHCNAAVSSTARGHEVFVSQYYMGSYTLGTIISEQIISQVAAIPPRKPAVKTRLRSDGEDFYYVINEPRKVGVPGVLVELGFLTNNLDANALSGFWVQFGLAHAIAQAVVKWLGGEGELEEVRRQLVEAQRDVDQLRRTMLEIHRLTLPEIGGSS